MTASLCMQLKDASRMMLLKANLRESDATP